MEQQPRRRRRPALSCVPCRHHKVKCDRANPCAPCRAAQRQCVYKAFNIEPRSCYHFREDNPIDSTLRPVASTSPPLVTTAYAGVATVTTESGGVPSRSRPVTTTAANRNDTQASSRALVPASDCRDHVRQVDTAELASGSALVRSNLSQDSLTCQSGMYDAQSSLDKTRILRWSHWAETATEFNNIYACFTDITSNSRDRSSRIPDERIGDLLHKCKDIARRCKAGRPSRNLSRLEFNLDLPSRTVADMMVDAYFRSFESAYRILHIPTFRTEYERCWEHSNNITTDVRLRILLVIAIGSSLFEHGETNLNFRNQVHQWVYAAQDWLSGPLEKNRLELGGIQVHCLTILARQILSIGGDLIWISMGSLMNSAMQLGLHRSAKNFPAMSVLQIELRKRLWATILEMVLQSSLDSAMPPRISQDEFDNEPPSNIDDDEIGQSTIEVQTAPRGTFKSTSMQLILLDSLSTRLRILQLLNGIQTELSYTDVLSLSSDIINACRKCSQFLNSNAMLGVTPFHKNLLDYFVRRFLIPLHCPFASKARINPLFFYSSKVSLDTALAIVSSEQDKDFLCLMAVGGGSFREGFRAASTVISIELLAQVQSQSLDETLQHQLAHRNFLKQIMNHMITLSAERIQKGETNVKSHLFLSMVMAEVDAMETGASTRIRIAQRARESLEFCYGLLLDRVAADALPSIDGDLPMDPFGYQEDYEYDFNSFLLNNGFP